MRPTHLWKPPFRTIDGKPRGNGAIRPPSALPPMAQPHLAPPRRWCAPDNVEILRQARQDLMTREPGRFPFAGNRSEYTDVGQIRGRRHAALLSSPPSFMTRHCLALSAYRVA